MCPISQAINGFRPDKHSCIGNGIGANDGVWAEIKTCRGHPPDEAPGLRRVRSAERERPTAVGEREPESDVPGPEAARFGGAGTMSECRRIDLAVSAAAAPPAPRRAEPRLGGGMTKRGPTLVDVGSTHGGEMERRRRRATIRRPSRAWSRASPAPPRPSPPMSVRASRRAAHVVLQSWDLSCGAAAFTGPFAHRMDACVTEGDVVTALARGRWKRAPGPRRADGMRAGARPDPDPRRRSPRGRPSGGPRASAEGRTRRWQPHEDRERLRAGVDRRRRLRLSAPSSRLAPTSSRRSHGP